MEAKWFKHNLAFLLVVKTIQKLEVTNFGQHLNSNHYQPQPPVIVLLETLLPNIKGQKTHFQMAIWLQCTLQGLQLKKRKKHKQSSLLCQRK